VLKGAPIEGCSGRVPAAVALRHADGTPRHADEIDAEFVSHAQRIVRSGGRCLVVLTDLSKTGLLAPSPACATRLKTLRQQLDVLVDACQFRLSPSTLRSYLEQGFMVAITGSKFLPGRRFVAPCCCLPKPPMTFANGRCMRCAVLRAHRLARGMAAGGATR